MRTPVTSMLAPPNHRRLDGRRPAVFGRTSGFTIVEVLVSLVILSIGLLGIAKLVLYSAHSNDSAYLRSRQLQHRAHYGRRQPRLQLPERGVPGGGQSGGLRRLCLEDAPGGSGGRAAFRARLGHRHDDPSDHGDHRRAMGRLGGAIHIRRHRRRRGGAHERHLGNGVTSMSNIPQSLVTQHAARRARGFSIVELMVAITLALIVTAAVMAAFLGSRSSFMNTTGTAAVSDNGRFALDFLQSAVRDAGYMACNTTQRQISLINIGASTIYYNFGQPLGGYEAASTVSNPFTLAAAPGANSGTPVTPDASLTDWH